MLKYCRIAFTTVKNESNFEIFELKKDIQTFDAAANSVILSAAAYIVKYFPNLPHPNLYTQKPPHSRVDGEYPSLCLSVHPLFDQWVEILANSFQNGNACRFKQTLYLKIGICSQYADILKIASWQSEIKDRQLSVHQIFKLPLSLTTKKIAWLNCGTSQLKNQLYQPRVNTIAILLGQIYSNQQYHFFNILKHQIPIPEQLIQYDTVIIPGSGLSVLSEIPQIQKLSKCIYEAYHKSDKLKVLGICYGHQLMAKLFDATIVKRERAKGLQLVRFSELVIKQYQFLSPLAKLQSFSLHLSEHHQDFVVTIPKGFHQLGTSHRCENQAFVSENGRIFSTQFHPQYNYPYTKSYAYRLKIHQKGCQQQKIVYQHSETVLQEHLKSCQLLRQCILNFI